MDDHDIEMKTGDLRPGVQATLTDNTGNPVNIAGATVRFVMATRASPREVVIDTAASNDQAGDGSDGSKGKVSYEWVDGDTETAGTFLSEFEVTYASGITQTFPTVGYKTVNFTEDLGGTV